MPNKSKMSDIVNPLVRAFNLEHGGTERGSDIIPLSINSSFRRWRRGDGSFYKDANRIVAFDDDGASLQKEFFGWLLQQPGVKPAGKIRGEFRSSDYADAVKYKGIIFVKRGYATEYFTPSKLRNSDVWHQKTD